MVTCLLVFFCLFDSGNTDDNLLSFNTNLNVFKKSGVAKSCFLNFML